MRFIPPAVAVRRAGRVATHAEYLIWIRAKNRSTGAVEAMGLWTGADMRQIMGRDYYGAGNVLRIEPIQSRVGIEVRSYEAGLSVVSPEVETLIRGYDVRLAPCEVHQAEFDDDGNLLAEPQRIFRGWIDGVDFPTAAVGDQSEWVVRLVSDAASLTIHGGDTKSDTVQQRRQGDRFRRYGSVADAEVAWGELRSGASMPRLKGSDMRPVIFGGK